MGKNKKQFNLLTSVRSEEVSLCTKYNSGANKQTEFELVKDKEGTKDSSMKEVLTKMIDMCDEIKPECCGFHDFLEYWLEYDINNTYYRLLSEALQTSISDIQYCSESKEEKEKMFRNLFDMFIEEYKTLPITKTKDGKYEVSLSTNSHIQDVVENPQNETDNITKEKTSTMKHEELSVIEKAFETIAVALGLRKTESPAEKQPVDEAKAEETEIAEDVEAPAETPANEEEVKPAEEEAPVVEEAVKEEVEDEQVAKTEEEVKEEIEAPAEEDAPEEDAPQEEAPAEEEIEKSSTQETEMEALLKAKMEVEKELAELKKSNELKEIEIEKMSYVQKAKDEYSMLVGTPEEIGEKLYSIAKSSLDEEVKSFVMEQLKKVSESNESLTEEVGSITKNAGEMTDEEMLYAEAEKIAKAENISINKALRKVK